jgi:AcrR family transcriptional regulator
MDNERSAHSSQVVDGRFLRGIDSRAKLIRAAILQFSMFGADGASIRQIAKEADVAFQSIAYHFGSKQELWLAVIEELFDLAHKQLSELQSLDIGLEALIRTLIESSIREPYLRRVVVHEYLNGTDRFSSCLLPRLKKLGISWRHLLAKQPELSGDGALTAIEAQLLINGFIHLNSLCPDEISRTLNRPLEDPDAVSTQVELFLSLLTKGRGPGDKTMLSANLGSRVVREPMPAHPARYQAVVAAPHRLLTAATDMFAQRGYHNTSLRDISQVSGVAYQLVRYHFGSKLELWTVCLSYLIDRYFEELNVLRFDPRGDVSLQLESWLRGSVYYTAVETRFRRIFTRESFANSGHFMRALRPRLDEVDSLFNFSFDEMRASGAVHYLSTAQVSLLLLSLGIVNALQPNSVEFITGTRISNPKSINILVGLQMKLMQGVNKKSGRMKARPHTVKPTVR